MTMQNIERPLSPHLQVYKPQLTSVLSILHRATGTGLAVGTLIVAWWLLAALAGNDAFAMAQQFKHSLVGRLMFFAWIFAFFFHFLNGVRHLFWDAGHGLDIKSAYRSGWLVVAGAIVLTLFLGRGILLHG